MNGPSPEMIELFLQEASEHLQFLREYSGILQDPYPLYEDIERLYISAHGVAGTGGTYGYSLFNEVASKLAHIFQYAMNASVSPEATAPLVEFIYEAIAVLESDLIMISANGVESVEDIAAFKLRYPFAFQGPPPVPLDAPTEQPHPHYPEPGEVESSQAESESPQYGAPQYGAPAQQYTPPSQQYTPPAPPYAPPPPRPPAPPQYAAPQRPPVLRPSAPVRPAAPTPPVRPSAPGLPRNVVPHEGPPVPFVERRAVRSTAPPPLEERRAAAPSAEPLAEPPVASPVAPEVPPVADVQLAPPLAASLAVPVVERPAAPVPPIAPVVPPAVAAVAPPVVPLAPVPPIAPIAPPPAFAVPVAPPAVPEAPVVAAPAPVAPSAPAPAAIAPPIAPVAPLAPSVAAPPVAASPVTARDFIDDVPELLPDKDIPDEVLEFFVPEVEEHLAAITDCLLSLEARPNEEDINRLFRSMHTIKGSAAQVGWHRIATIAHCAEDVVGRLRDGELQPSATIIDLCLETVDVVKRLVYRQWEDEAGFQLAARSLMSRLEHVSPAEAEPAPSLPAPIEAVPEPVAAAPEIPVVAPSVAPYVASSAIPSAAPVAASPVAPLEAPLAVPAAASLSVPSAARFATQFIPQAPEQTPAEAAPLSAEAMQLAAMAAPFAAPPPESGEEIAPEAKPPMTAAAGTPVGMAQSKSVRIALERLDRMMNAVGELVINRTRMLGRLAELEKLAEVLNFSKGRMSEKVLEFQDKYEFSRIGAPPVLQAGQWPGMELERHAGSYGGSQPFGSALSHGGGYSGGGYSGGGYGGALGGHGTPNYSDPHYGGSFDTTPSEFSELEMDRYDDFGILSRSLTEISADITEVLTQLDGFVRRVDGDIDEFTKLAHRLQDEITQARMVPIGNLFTRIARTVRDAAKASNKQVELTLAGAETELDNNIIQQIADPLLHLVRNSVAHGIERADERYEAGKPDHGNIAVRAYHKGNHIYVEVEDDGRGVDFDRVKATAVENGSMTAEQADRLDRREMLDLLFRPGFSTSPRRTELAGRGVGLDVVRTNVANLNGEIEIETEKGIGTRFTLKVPLTLIISQALFVQCGEQTFAFPLGYVEEIRRIRTNEIEEVGGKLITKVRDVLTEVVRFDESLQLPELVPVNGYLRLVLVNVGGRQVGVVVEEVLRKDEIVIKSLGEYLRHVKLFPGATIAPDGSLILLVDVHRLVMGESIERRPLTTAMNASRLFMPGAMAVARGEIPSAAVDRLGKEKLVVLADDSISVRKFVGRMLEKAGYRVKLACDGLEALEIATSNDCDLVITDLEMPRTNGYELMLHLRQTPSTSKVPVMVVTSRAGAKHRERALKEGAAAFMVKPVQEESFIAQVEELIGTSGQLIAPAVVH